MSQIILQIAIFIVTVLVLVTIHEFGHYWVAKRLGVKVLRFSVGFGKSLIRWKGKNNTEYAISWMPLGGYVKLLDEREAPVPDDQKPYAFNRQSLLKRFLIVLAGPGINMLFAILAFWAVWIIGIERADPIIGNIIPDSIAEQSGLTSGETIVAVDNKIVDGWGQVGLSLVKKIGSSGTLLVGAGESKTQGIHVYQLNINNWRVDGLNPDPLKSLGIEPYTPPVLPIIETIVSGGPADKAGLKQGDIIVQLNGIAVEDWMDVLKYIRANPNAEMRMAVQRGDQIIAVDAESGQKFSGLKRVGYLGIQAAEPVWPEDMRYKRKLSIGAAFNRALLDTWDFTAFHFIVLKKMITGELSLSSLAGPIAIYQVTNQAFHQGLVVYIAFLGLISIMLACVNILPIPGLDGGHLLFFVVEAVTRKPISVRFQALMTRIGLIFIVVLIFHATINDVMRLG